MKTSKRGINYDIKILQDKKTVVSRAIMYGISRSSGEIEVSLKIGRYNKKRKVGKMVLPIESLESETPKSELTLTNEEFLNLIEYIKQNYAPFREGVADYIPVENSLTKKNSENIRKLLNQPKNAKILDYIVKEEIISDELFHSLKGIEKVKAVKEFEQMLSDDLVEHKWQDWFEKNNWVLGSEFVSVLDERNIDTHNISDFLIQAYDGFLDIVEIKRPEGQLTFWMASKDHGNYVPSSDLMKAITQSTKYIYEVERESNSVKFLERVKNVKTIKPRCILIYGRSNDWNDEQKESYRILNSSFHNLTILTYDHVLARAKKMIEFDEIVSKDNNKDENSHDSKDLPF
mgnify:CR=1 FL=1